MNVKFWMFCLSAVVVVGCGSAPMVQKKVDPNVRQCFVGKMRATGSGGEPFVAQVKRQRVDDTISERVTSNAGEQKYVYRTAAITGSFREGTWQLDFVTDDQIVNYGFRLEGDRLAALFTSVKNGRSLAWTGDLVLANWSECDME